jgi:hypothetical protein
MLSPNRKAFAGQAGKEKRDEARMSNDELMTKLEDREAVILTEVKRSRRIPWRYQTVMQRDSSTPLGMTVGFRHWSLFRYSTFVLRHFN